jgi:hypothetical protein
MLGGISDGIAQALTSSLHFENGIPLEGSWDNNYYYTRQWNVPPEVEVIVMPPTTGEPGGAGEFGVAASMAAVACAYARATGTVPTQTFSVNGKTVSVDVEDDVRLIWVLRDLLGVHGPKYGCGLEVCRACTSHFNGKAFNPCSVPVGDLQPTDEITTIEGLPATVGRALHPMQEAWLAFDVPQLLPTGSDHGGGGPGQGGPGRG